MQIAIDIEITLIHHRYIAVLEFSTITIEIVVKNPRYWILAQLWGVSTGNNNNFTVKTALIRIHWTETNSFLRLFLFDFLFATHFLFVFVLFHFGIEVFPFSHSPIVEESWTESTTWTFCRVQQSRTSWNQLRGEENLWKICAKFVENTWKINSGCWKLQLGSELGHFTYL